MASSAGNQIFINLKKGKAPSKVIEVRVKYEQTIGDLRRLAAKKAGIEVSQLQLFRHGKEMLADRYDSKTLLELNLHTGFSLMGYDLTDTPDYWPPVRPTPQDGLEVIPRTEVVIEEYAAA